MDSLYGTYSVKALQKPIVDCNHKPVRSMAVGSKFKYTILRIPLKSIHYTSDSTKKKKNPQTELSKSKWKIQYILGNKEESNMLSCRGIQGCHS